MASSPVTPGLHSPNYDNTAWFYEFAASVFSAGQISKAKCSQLKFLEPGARVLYLGVGAGEDALEAARQGFQVTCVELSAKMLDRLQAKLDKAGLHAELICGDALKHQRLEHYDAVMTNFFLNVFPEPQVVLMLRHAVSLIRPGGKYMIADCAVPQGWLPSRLFNRVWLRFGMGWYWLLGLAAWHKTYDYREHFERSGVAVDTVELFRFFDVGPVLFWNIVATKSSSEHAEKQSPRGVKTTA